MMQPLTQRARLVAHERAYADGGRAARGQRAGRRGRERGRAAAMGRLALLRPAIDAAWTWHVRSPGRACARQPRVCARAGSVLGRWRALARARTCASGPAWTAGRCCCRRSGRQAHGAGTSRRFGRGMRTTRATASRRASLRAGRSLPPQRPAARLSRPARPAPTAHAAAPPGTAPRGARAASGAARGRSASSWA